MRHDAFLRAFFVFATLSALLLTDIVITNLSFSGLLIALVILGLTLPMSWRYIHGGLDLFEPLVLANFALGVMFIGRPLADIASGTLTHLDYSITATFDEALQVVLVGVLAFQIGYHAPFARVWARKLRRPPPFRPQRAKIAAWLFFALGGMLFGLFLIQGGGFGLLFVLLKGRAQEDNDIFLKSSAYFYNGILMWGASALIFFALATVLKRRMNYLWFIAMALPLIIFFGARGTRIQLLPLVLALPTFWYLWKGRRPSSPLLVAAAIVGMVLIGWLGAIRTVGTSDRADAGAVLMDALTSPVEQIGETLNGADNEMFDSIANELLIVPDNTGYHPGGSVTDVFTRMVPRQLWPNKPLETNDVLVNTLWPLHYYNSRASAAFSIVGPFYLDSGYLGVILGMFLIGTVLAAAWHWYLVHRDNLNAVLIYSMGLPFAVILMRGSLPDTIARMLFIVFPLVIMMWASRMRRRQSVVKVLYRQGSSL